MASGDIDYGELSRAIVRALKQGGFTGGDSGGFSRRRFDDLEYDSDKEDGPKSEFGQKFSKTIDGFSKVSEKLENIVYSFKRVDDELKGLAKNWAAVDDAAAKYARSMGQTAEGLNQARKNALKGVTKGFIGFDFGMDPEELMKAQDNYAKAVGRSVRMSMEDSRSLAAVSAVFGNESTAMLADFEKFGLSIDKAGSHLGKMYKEAGEAGISLEQYTKNVQQGLATAQKYNFRNGLRGMEAMAKRAAEIKMDMGQVESFAGRFGTIEDSIKNAAQLQVLGGSFAQGADAIGLLHASLSDLGELQERMAKFTEGIGVFNKSTGEVEINDVDRLRLKQYAEVTGQDFQKVMETARRQTLRGEIGAQIATSAHAAGLSKDMQEMIKNIGTFQNGKAGVSIDGEFKTIEELVDDDLEELKKAQYNDSDNIKDIAKNVRSLTEYRKGVEAQYKGVQASTIGAFVGNIIMKPLTKWFTQWKGIGNFFLGAVAALNALTVVPALLKGGRGVTRGFRGARRLLKSGWKGGVGATETAANAIGGLGKTGQYTASQFGKEGIAVFGKNGNRIFGNAALSRVNSVGIEAATNGAVKGTTEAAANIAKNGSRLAKAGATFAKTAKTAKNVRTALQAGKLAKGVAIGAQSMGAGVPIVGGLISAGIEAYENKEQFKDRATRGSAIGKTAGAGIGAAIGTALGAAIPIPVLGPIIGGVIGEKVGKFVGGAIGKIQDKRVTKNRAIIDNQLAKEGIKRKGDYSVATLKDIDKALQTGKMTNKLRRKLMSEGDSDIVNQINKVKDQKKEQRKEKLKKAADFLGFGKKKDKEDIKKKIGVAHFEVQSAHFNGVSIKGRGASGEGKGIAKKSLIGATAGLTLGGPVGAVIGGVLGGVTSIIKGKKETGENKLGPIKETNLTRTANDTESTKSGKFDVSINGSIKLETPNGQSFDLMEAIKNNPTLINKLTEEIIKQMNVRKNGAYVEDRQRGDNFV